MMIVKKINNEVQVHIKTADPHPIFGDHIYNIVNLDDYYLLVSPIDNKTKKVFDDLNSLLKYVENKFKERITVET